MGRMSLTINAKASPVITINSKNITSCYTEASITIDVPSGTKHVEIISSGQGANTDLEETISADKTYSLVITGDDSGNIVGAQIQVLIRDTDSTGALLEIYTLARTHSGNFC